MSVYKRTLRGMRADRGNLRQIDVANELNMNLAVYNGIEQFIDNPSVADAIGKFYGVKIEVTIRDSE